MLSLAETRNSTHIKCLFNFLNKKPMAYLDTINHKALMTFYHNIHIVKFHALTFLSSWYMYCQEQIISVNLQTRSIATYKSHTESEENSIYLLLSNI